MTNEKDLKEKLTPKSITSLRIMVQNLPLAESMMALRRLELITVSSVG